MAWTYETLKTAIREYLVELDDDDLEANLDTIITQAEDRILKAVQMPDFRKNVTGTMTSGDQYLGIPDDFLSVYSLGVNDSGMEFLIYKDVNFLREAYPSASTEGTPRYYGIWDDAFFIVAPTPDQNFEVELHYFHKPESITVAVSGTSWLGTHAESSFFSVCLHEGYVFLKGDPDLMEKYKNQAEEAIAGLKQIGEARNRTDSYRSGI